MLKLKWLGVALVTAVVYFLVSEVDSLTCDRDRGTCTVAHRKLYRSLSQSFPVADLTGAELAEYARDDDAATSHRVVISTRQGPIPLMNHGTGLGVSKMADEVAAIQRFAADPSIKHLEVEHRNRLVAVLVAAFAFVVCGAIVVARSL
jgi:hypothetical protein